MPIAPGHGVGSGGRARPEFVTALVLGAGASTRLGQPKQLLAYRGQPLLQAAIHTASSGMVDQVIVAIGGAAPEVRDAIDFRGATVVENLHFTSGCSSSIVAALDVIDARASGLVLMLGDQPGVTTESITALILDASTASAPLGVCRYDNGRGHPFWFDRSIFPALRDLHGDKGVWKLLESGRYPIIEVPRPGPVPIDVDTWEDYKQLLALHAESTVESHPALRSEPNPNSAATPRAETGTTATVDMGVPR